MGIFVWSLTNRYFTNLFAWKKSNRCSNLNASRKPESMAKKRTNEEGKEIGQHCILTLSCKMATSRGGEGLRPHGIRLKLLPLLSSPFGCLNFIIRKKEGPKSPGAKHSFVSSLYLQKVPLTLPL